MAYNPRRCNTGALWPLARRPEDGPAACFGDLMTRILVVDDDAVTCRLWPRC